MIKRIHIYQFGGLREKNVNLKSGLNLIVGDNETGKSSLMQALFFLFFQNAKYLKTNKNFIEKAIPYPNGDMASACVCIEVEGEVYEIEKRWSSKNSQASLKYQGMYLTDDDKIRDKIATLLPYGEGTYANLVFGRQNDFRQLFERIRKDKDSSHQIGDMMSRLSIELSGLSINAYRNKLQQEYRRLTSRWDIQNGRPEGNRGIENPYRKEVGKILSLYYEREQLRLQMEEGEVAEKALNHFSEELKSIKKEMEEIKVCLEEKEGMESEVRAYGNLTQIRETLKQEVRSSHEDYVNWPIVEAQQMLLKEKVKDADFTQNQIENEMRRARDYDQLKEWGMKIQEAEELERHFEDIKAKWLPLNCFIEENRIVFETLSEKLRLNRAQLEAASIEVVMRHGEAVSVDWQGRKKNLPKGSREIFHGYLRLFFQDGTDMELQSHNLDLHSLKEEYTVLSQSMNELKERLNQGDDAIIRESFVRSMQLERQMQEYEIRINMLDLPSDREKIKSEISQYEQNPPREFKELYEEFKQIMQEKNDLLKEEEKLVVQMDALKQRYGSKEALLTQMLDKNYELKKTEESLALLKDKRKEFSWNYETFSQDLRNMRQREKQLFYQENQIRKVLMETQIKQVDLSVEEMREQIEALSLKIEQETIKAMKLMKILSIFEKTCEELSGYTHNALSEEFTKNLLMITGGRYQASQTEHMEKIHLLHKNQQLPLHILSEGTFESVALAFRLAAVHQLIKEHTGFITLDDCLLNMDESRRKRAAKLIEEYAQKYQVIFTTCSSEIINLFSEKAHRIHLESD